MDKRKKQHYPWWNYVKYIVQQYPAWNKASPYEEMLRTDWQGWGAVRRTIDLTERTEDGLSRMKVIRLVHWDRTHTLEGAALSVPCSRSLASKWQREFFEEVARNRGLLD